MAMAIYQGPMFDADNHFYEAHDDVAEAAVTQAQKDIEARSLKVLCVTYNMAGKIFRTRDSK